jgi:glycine oxidase
MGGLSGMRVVVAGGGAIGSAVALAARRAQAEVVLADPAELGDNASGVAAGMLAPAFEAALDPTSAGHFELYREARELWPAFAESLGAQASLERCGALWVAQDDAERDAMLQRLLALGAQAWAVTAQEAARLSPGLAAPSGAVFTPEDGRLEPRAMLAAMREAFRSEGGALRRANLTDFDRGRATLSDGQVKADAVILTSGLAPKGFADAPAEASVLNPIKGQILRAVGRAPAGGPILRGQGVYVVPGADGPWIGATMEAGASDRRIDPQTSARLSAQASLLVAGLAGAKMEASAGVRAATPDGLPLVGESSRASLFLALGARRNGWLLAPMLAGLIVESLAGRGVPARLDARRFDLARAG